MAIDVQHDELISLGTLVSRIAPVNGTRPNISTAWRWCHKGIKRIRLETVEIGGRTCTTWAAYEAFAKAIAASKGSTPTPAPVQPVRKRKRVLNAASVLAAAGIG